MNSHLICEPLNNYNNATHNYKFTEFCSILLSTKNTNFLLTYCACWPIADPLLLTVQHISRFSPTLWKELKYQSVKTFFLSFKSNCHFCYVFCSYLYLSKPAFVGSSSIARLIAWMTWLPPSVWSVFSWRCSSLNSLGSLICKRNLYEKPAF